MPAVMEDPAGPTLFRVSGQPPFPDPSSPGLPADMDPRQVTLRDRQTVATIVPVASRHQLPASLLAYLCDQLNREIDGGDTYPMTDPFSVDGFADYWFQGFSAVMLLGTGDVADDGADNARDWARECLGSFFIKPNYPGRSSHVCNGSFIVTDGSRNRGVGRLMGEAYLDWAPRLGYTYSVFNLVYETNVASCRIWDALGFRRIGRVKSCGNLRSHPDRLVDAIIYGRELAVGPPGGNCADGDELLVSEERFDKIRYYLKYGRYPNGANRAEKSRLRSAATHYKLLEGDKLMLKDKEVISDPARQYDIARSVHAIHHGGINKTTATIAERYHWSRIKETVSDVIRACAECRELGKTPNPGGTRRTGAPAPAGAAPAAMASAAEGPAAEGPPGPDGSDDMAGAGAAERVLALQQQPHQQQQHHNQQQQQQHHNQQQQQQSHGGLVPDLSQPTPSTTTPTAGPGSAYANPSDISVLPTHTLQSTQHHHHQHHHPPPPHHHHSPMLQDQPAGHHHHHHHHHHHSSPVYNQPIDPQIINHHHHHHPPPSPPPPDDSPFDQVYHPHADFHALLDDDDAAAVDRDLEMLIDEPHDDDVDARAADADVGMVGLDDTVPP